MGLFLSVCAGLGLAAACGLRVFLPLFMVSIGVKAGWVEMPAAFEWMGSNAAVVIFGTATVVEVVGFLIPWVDHILDVMAVPLSAVAGALLMTSQLLHATGATIDPQTAGEVAAPLMHPALAWSLGIIAGAGTASGVEAASIAGRVSSSVLTIGWLNPIYGMMESVLSFITTLLALAVPIITGIIVLLFIPIVLAAVWRLWAWRRKQRQAHEEKLRLARERIAVAMSHRAQQLTESSGRP
ncbi:MAG: DUF4126 domain-containing protein [Phycisphaerales bacterium]